MKDAQGKVTGRKFTLVAQPKLQYRFAELHAAYTDYLDKIVEMLERLRQIAILRR
jgi:hypothetical protein